MKYLTPEGLQKLKNELQERKTIQRQKIAKRLEEAKALGDLAENTEYAAAKESQAFNEGRILELEEMMRNATVIKPTQKGQGKKKVVMGSIVEVKDPRFLSLRKQIFIIVGSQEAQPSQRKISNESPLGQALLGHQVGDIVEVETPGGKMRYKIVSIK